jgi:hypothetical protein
VRTTSTGQPERNRAARRFFWPHGRCDGRWRKWSSGWRIGAFGGESGADPFLYRSAGCRSVAAEHHFARCDRTGFFGGANGSKVTWLSLEGVSIVFDNGLLVGTRGFGDDLMGGDVAAAKASQQRGGTHLRTLDFLNGLSQIERRTYQCVSIQTGNENITIVERTYATTVIEETCSGENESFKNTYWHDGNGVIWQSRQWISSGVGYLGYQRL